MFLGAADAVPQPPSRLRFCVSETATRL